VTKFPGVALEDIKAGDIVQYDPTNGHVVLSTTEVTRPDGEQPPEEPREPRELLESIAVMATAALASLDNLTTDEFSKGGDKLARVLLQDIIDECDKVKE
jgi:hypothetical protein